MLCIGACWIISLMRWIDCWWIGEVPRRHPESFRVYRSKPSRVSALLSMVDGFTVSVGVILTGVVLYVLGCYYRSKRSVSLETNCCVSDSTDVSLKSN